MSSVRNAQQQSFFPVKKRENNTQDKALSQKDNRPGPWHRENKSRKQYNKPSGIDFTLTVKNSPSATFTNSKKFQTTPCND